MDAVELEIELAQGVADIHGTLLNVKMAAEKYKEGKGKVEEFTQFLSWYEQKINGLEKTIESNKSPKEGKRFYKGIVSGNKALLKKIRKGPFRMRVKRWNDAIKKTPEDEITHALFFMGKINAMIKKIGEITREDIGGRV